MWTLTNTPSLSNQKKLQLQTLLASSNSFAGLLASMCSILPDQKRSLVFPSTRARWLLPWQVEDEKMKKATKIPKTNKTIFLSSLPEGTLCYSEGEIRHYCQVNDECLICVYYCQILYQLLVDKMIAKNLFGVKDSLCLPRDPALATRSLLEEGEYSPRDLLILDKQVILLMRILKLCCVDEFEYSSGSSFWCLCLLLSLLLLLF